MKRTHRPLNALRVFDAAARHLSFTRAADELAVTPAAGYSGPFGAILLGAVAMVATAAAAPAAPAAPAAAIPPRAEPPPIDVPLIIPPISSGIVLVR